MPDHRTRIGGPPSTRTAEARIRDRFFAGEVTLDRKRGGFAAFPIILRRALFLFSPRSWEVYSYIAMRAGPEGVAWMAISEMAWDLDFRSVPKLRPYVQNVVVDGWLRTISTQGKDYFLVRDPNIVIRELHQKGRIPIDRVLAISELLESLKYEPLITPQETAAMAAAGTAPPEPREIDDDDMPF